MKSIRMMLLGIGLLLFGIFCRVMGIGYLYGSFWIHYLPIISVIIGLICLVLGFMDVLDED